MTSYLSKTLYIQAGKPIIKQGEETREAYIIEEGTVQVIKDDNMVIATLSKNEIFGEIGWLEHIPRSATVKAVTDCTLKVIKPENAELFMKHNPKALIPILKIVCNRMSSMLEYMHKLDKENFESAKTFIGEKK